MLKTLVFTLFNFLKTIKFTPTSQAQNDSVGCIWLIRLCVLTLDIGFSLFQRFSNIIVLHYVENLDVHVNCCYIWRNHK